MIVSFDAGSEHAHVATRRELRRLLRAADGEPADVLVDQLHEGNGLVLAELPEAAA